MYCIYKSFKYGNESELKKTQLLCISANKISDVRSFVKVGDEKIVSGSELKLLGFMFGNTPSINPHVNYMLKKARKKLWTIRHLKRAGLGQEDLLKVFNTCIRPTLEYVAPTYHPMLTKEMSDNIEQIQRRAIKLIYGWDADYQKLLDEERITSLSTRREELTLKFAKKTAENTRFSDWFVKKIPGVYDIRNEKKYVEYYGRTERLRKSPLFYMRRMLNEEK